MNMPSCHTCRREFTENDTAWASDWTVIDNGGTRTETRYTCDTCVCPNPHCDGGTVDTSPAAVTRAPWLQSDTPCPVCDGTGDAA